MSASFGACPWSTARITASSAPPGGVQRDPFVRHADAARPDAGPQVATGVGAEGGVQDVVGYVEPDEQPTPVWVVTGATDEAAVSGGDDLGGIVEMSRVRVDLRALGSDDVAEDGLDKRLLAREVVVERAEADVGLVGDLLDARAVDPLTGEQGSGGVEELRSCRLASPRLPIWGCGHDSSHMVAAGNSGIAKAPATAR